MDVENRLDFGVRFEQRVPVEYFRERVEEVQVELQLARSCDGSREAPRGRWRQKVAPMGRKMHQKEVHVKSVEALAAMVAPVEECKLSLWPVVHYT